MKQTTENKDERRKKKEENDETLSMMLESQSHSRLLPTFQNPRDLSELTRTMQKFLCKQGIRLIPIQSE